MKKTIVVLLIMMNIVSVNASSNDPKYKIIANSNSDKDIKTMYETKDDLIKDYKDWIKSVDDVDQALADHQKDYQAKYYNGEYTIVLGAGKESYKFLIVHQVKKLKRNHFLQNYFLKIISEANPSSWLYPTFGTHFTDSLLLCPKYN